LPWSHPRLEIRWTHPLGNHQKVSYGLLAVVDNEKTQNVHDVKRMGGGRLFRSGDDSLENPEAPFFQPRFLFERNV
jgi:hypothetical protein